MSRETIDDHHDRPRGVLSKTDREFLASDGEGYSRQAAYERKKAIRERVVNAFKDFSILFEHWDAEERERVLAPAPEDELQEGITDLLALLYAETDPINRFKPYLYRGVSKAEQEYANHSAWRVSVTFEVETPEEVDLEAAHFKYRSGRLKDLSEAEMASLLKTYRRVGVVDPDQLTAEDLSEEVAAWQEAVMERQRVRREKQGRGQDRGNNSEEDTDTGS